MPGGLLLFGVSRAHSRWFPPTSGTRRGMIEVGRDAGVVVPGRISRTGTAASAGPRRASVVGGGIVNGEVAA